MFEAVSWGCPGRGVVTLARYRGPIRNIRVCLYGQSSSLSRSSFLLIRQSSVTTFAPLLIRPLETSHSRGEQSCLSGEPSDKIIYKVNIVSFCILTLSQWVRWCEAFYHNSVTSGSKHTRYKPHSPLHPAES